MSRLNFKSRAKAGLVVLILVVGIGVYFLRSGNSKPNTQPSSSQQTAATSSSQSASVAAQNFSYTQPAGWAALPQQTLTAESATSGMAEVSVPNAKFTVAVEPASTTPITQAELKNSTLAAIQQFSNYKLLSYSTPQVADQTALQFVYNFDNGIKMRQELTIVIHNNQAYSLLFTCRDSDFVSEQQIFNKILDSFKFK